MNKKFMSKEISDEVFKDIVLKRLDTQFSMLSHIGKACVLILERQQKDGDQSKELLEILQHLKNQKDIVQNEDGGIVERVI